MPSTWTAAIEHQTIESQNSGRTCSLTKRHDVSYFSMSAIGLSCFFGTQYYYQNSKYVSTPVTDSQWHISCQRNIENFTDHDFLLCSLLWEEVTPVQDDEDTMKTVGGDGTSSHEVNTSKASSPPGLERATLHFSMHRTNSADAPATAATVSPSQSSNGGWDVNFAPKSPISAAHQPRPLVLSASFKGLSPDISTIMCVSEIFVASLWTSGHWLTTVIWYQFA